MGGALTRAVRLNQDADLQTGRLANVLLKADDVRALWAAFQARGDNACFNLTRADLSDLFSALAKPADAAIYFDVFDEGVSLLLLPV